MDCDINMRPQVTLLSDWRSTKGVMLYWQPGLTLVTRLSSGTSLSSCLPSTALTCTQWWRHLLLHCKQQHACSQAMCSNGIACASSLDWTGCCQLCCSINEVSGLKQLSLTW